MSGVSGSTKVIVGHYPVGIKKFILQLADRALHDSIFVCGIARPRPRRAALRRALLAHSMSLALAVQKITEWCLNCRERSMHDLYNISCAHPHAAQCRATGVILTGRGTPPVLIKTPNGFAHVRYIYKTVPLRKLRVALRDGREISAADTHVFVITGGEQVAQDLSATDELVTLDGFSRVCWTRQLTEFTEMYNLELDDQENVYWTAGLLSQNTLVS